MPEILDAVAPRQSAVVMASAGTGKTWLLVTRLIRLLLAGARPDAILAVTFTRKAAAEMLSRLNERVRSFARMDDKALSLALQYIHAPDDPDTLQLARNLYEKLLFSSHSVRTTTFHAFCQELLQRFPLEADIPPGFELLEHTGMLEQEAWEALFDEATRAPDGELAQALEQLLDRCSGLHNSHTALMTLLRRRNDWWAYTENSTHRTQEASRRLQQLLQIDPETDCRAEFFSATRLQELNEFSLLLQKHATATNGKHAHQLQQALEQGQDRRASFTAIADVFLTAKNTPRARKESKAQHKAMGENGQQRFLQLHETLSQALLDTLELLARQHTLITSQAWFTAGDRLIEHYQRLKAEQRCLDFNDLEWKTCQLLNRSEHAHWVQYKLDQRVDHFLIDEFQDTNPTQWRLLLPMLEEISAAENERPRSTFLVGDPKQSIYRFRRADAGLLQNASDWLQQQLQAREYSMDHSRRSSPAIIQCVNSVFADPELQQRLSGFNPHHTHLTGLWGRVELLPLTSPDDADERDDTENDADPAPAALRNPLLTPRILQENLAPLREGRLIAATITRMIEEQWPVTHGNETRAMSYSDIFILLRTRSKAEQIEQALRDAGIPYTGAERGTLLHSLEIQDMEALLNILITPYNNLALAQVLKSPLFAVSDAELVALAQTPASGHWMARLLEVGATAPASLQRAARYLADWRSHAGRIPVHDLLDRIYSEGDVIGRYEAAFPASLRPRVRSNLTRFLELALEIDSGRYPSMTLFLSRLQALRNSPVDAPDQPPSGENLDRVQLLTIHASKGLEAPVVFIADSASVHNPRQSYEAIVEWPTAAPAPSCFLLTGKKEQLDSVSRDILARDQEQQQTEDANLLYVALTRARQYLYISGNKGERNSGQGWYERIAAQLTQIATLQGDRLVLESGAPPPLVEITATAPALENGEIDPRLGRAITTPASDIREIAPSKVASFHAPGTAVDEDGLTRGIAIHRILELLTSPQQTDEQQILNQLAYELAMTTGETPLREWYAEARDVVSDPRLAAYFDPRHYHEALNEVPILYSRNGTTINGIADRLIIAPERVVIIDYKTHRHARRENLPQLAEAYREQMEMYAEGVRRRWKEAVIEQVLLFTACREAYTLPGS